VRWSPRAVGRKRPVDNTLFLNSCSDHGSTGRKASAVPTKLLSILFGDFWTHYRTGSRRYFEVLQEVVCRCGIAPGPLSGFFFRWWIRSRRRRFPWCSFRFQHCKLRTLISLLQFGSSKIRIYARLVTARLADAVGLPCGRFVARTPCLKPAELMHSLPHCHLSIFEGDFCICTT
jgi:hypothetical protein